jgi:hypothetical protein
MTDGAAGQQMRDWEGDFTVALHHQSSLFSATTEQ